MIGSKRKVAMAMETLRQEGVPEETIAAIHSPIGLPIGAETPAEIAVCIIGEIIRETR
jgi:xanthine dehydrogenase accessory factor